MAMWLIDAFASGFSYSTDEGRLQLFRLLLGVAIMIKFAESIPHGGWNRFAAGTFERFRVERLHPNRRVLDLFFYAYRPVLVIRLLPAIALGAGYWPNYAAVGCILGLAFEAAYEWRRNVLFMILLCAFLLPGSALASRTSLFPIRMASSANTWSQFLIVILMVHVYWNSALQKLRSKQFRTGRMLAQYVHVRTVLQFKTAYREFYFPSWFSNRFGRFSTENIRTWKILSWGAVATEVLLPIGLLVPGLFWIAFSLGTCMHLAFTALMPRRLLHFSLASVATYFLFVPR